ncbi:hypothetical protein ACVWYG_001195 [Pedobacter sp. UYEF25]
MKKLIYVLAIGFMTICSVSCKKALNAPPIDSTYGSEFWTSRASVEQATAAMYGQLRYGLRGSLGADQGESSYFVFGDLVAGLFKPAGGDTFLGYGLSSTPSVSTKPWNFSYTPYWENDLQNWSRFYRVIAQCNLIMKKVPEMPTSLFQSKAQQNSYVAEAKFVRAYTYFTLTRIWGDPVYVGATYDDVDYGKIPPVPRSLESAVLDSCLRDLRSAKSALSFSGGDPKQTTRGNRGSVSALMAHIFAWKHNYDSAHYYAQEVITKGGYSLEPMSSYLNIWKGQVSRESIFEMPMQFSANDPNFKDRGSFAEATFAGFGGFLKGPAVDNVRSSCWIAPSGTFIDFKDKTVSTRDSLPATTLFDTVRDERTKKALKLMNASGGDPKGYMLLKYSTFNYQSPDTKSYPYISNNLVLFRLSDMYLLDAEALAYKGDLAGARRNLAFTQDRAGINTYTVPTNPFDMQEEVIKERGREFIGEGIWFYDLIRNENPPAGPHTHTWLEFLGYPRDRVSVENRGYYWPIDMNTLFPYDNLLTQNPWWKNNAGRY